MIYGMGLAGNGKIGRGYNLREQIMGHVEC